MEELPIPFRSMRGNHRWIAKVNGPDRAHRGSGPGRERKRVPSILQWFRSEARSESFKVEGRKSLGSCRDGISVSWRHETDLAEKHKKAADPWKECCG